MAGRRNAESHNWESLVESNDPSLDAYERVPHRSFDQWVRNEDARLEREFAAAKGSGLDLNEVTDRFRGAIGPKAGPVDIEVFGALALLLWGSDKRGSQETRIVREERKRAPFCHPIHALEFWLCNVSRIGMGEIRWNVAETRDEDVKARARELAQGRKLPIASDGARERGYLPAEHMPAKQSRNGSTGGARGENVSVLRADVCRAVQASGVGPIELEMLVSNTIGEPDGWDGDAMQVKYRRKKVGKGGAPSQEIVKRTATELAEKYSAQFGVEVSHIAIGKQMARTRGAIEEKLVEFGLMLGSRGGSGGGSYGDVPKVKIKPKVKLKPKAKTKAPVVELVAQTCPRIVA